jgi:hypothetical protein
MQDEDAKGGGPRYLVAYCSIMTLLLAFFIILQAFAPEQNEGMFYTGQGSFIRALKTFGLGGVWGRGGGGMHEHAGPRHLASEGQLDPPSERRINPDLEDAQHALKVLENTYEVQKPDDAVGHRVELSLPCIYAPGRKDLTDDEKRFICNLAPTLERVVKARNFVIRVSAGMPVRRGEEEQGAAAALAMAELVRQELIDNMSRGARDLAGRRIYSCSACAAPQASGAPVPVQMKIDILLTKPYVRQVVEGGQNEDANPSAG